MGPCGITFLAKAKRRKRRKSGSLAKALETLEPHVADTEIKLYIIRLVASRVNGIFLFHFISRFIGHTIDIPCEVAKMSLRAAGDVNSLEAPITWKAYALCAFASLGGIYFGYDSGYINGVNGIAMWVDIIEPGRTTLTASHSSLIVSILSAGTFFGAVLAGDVAEWIGRKWTVICGCAICLLALSFKCSLALEVTLLVSLLPVV